MINDCTYYQQESLLCLLCGRMLVLPLESSEGFGMLPFVKGNLTDEGVGGGIPHFAEVINIRLVRHLFQECVQISFKVFNMLLAWSGDLFMLS